ncbi:MAG: CDGSH iron-sulfur domain-containing protein [Cyclobacteriaceae bacterium]
MEKGKVAGKAPIAVEVEAGKNYAWCTCGESTNQPFCDGKHKGGSFRPNVIKAEESKTIYFCTCKQTSNPSGFCDGAHSKL